MSSSCILIMAGGTGGHVFPALAVAAELASMGNRVQWLGTCRGIEAKLVPAAGITLNTIEVEGVRGKGLISLIAAPFKLMVSLAQSRAVIKKVRPHLVLGFGGFASGPGGVMARLAGIPLVVHEQNAKAGTTNRLLSKIASRNLEAFDSGLKRAERVGNPVRQEICAVLEPEARFRNRTGPIRLLVLGGSLGAQSINELVPKTIALLTNNQFEIYHQTGEKHFEITKDLYKASEIKDARIVPFINDMAQAYSWADVVICRSGALTVSEISVVGLAALFIPFPFAIDDHQTANANWLVSHNAAWLHQQKDLTPEVLAQMLNDKFADRALLLNMAINARAQAKPHAAQVVAEICQEVLRD